MGLLRNLAHTIFGFLLLTALWITALSFLSMRPSATAVVADLGVDALNPWLITQHIGLDSAAYGKLEQAASAHPDQPIPLTFIKPQIKGSEIKALPYGQGVRLIYTRVAQAYYDGGPTATFNFPSQIAGVVQDFALFPEQYDAAVKAASLPTWLQPFLLFTGLSPETLTATGHARITALLPKFWLATIIFAGAIFLLNLLGRKNPVQSLALAAWHGTWPTVAFFAILWLIGVLYPARVQPVAGAFGVVASAFLPVYGVAAVVGVGAYLISRFAGAMFGSFAKAGSAQKAPVAARSARSGYEDQRDEAPAYVPGARNYPGSQQDAAWNPQPRQSWEQPPQQQQGWGAAPAPDAQPGAWNQPRPWDAPDPNAQRQGGQGASWGSYPPPGPDDPTAPRW